MSTKISMINWTTISCSVLNLLLTGGCSTHSTLQTQSTISETSQSSDVQKMTEKRADGKPNIIFIFADDWGWGDLSCHGHKGLKTPNIDRLAAEGMDFYEFTVNAPVCSPSRCAVITGQFPARHRIYLALGGEEKNDQYNQANWVDPNVVTLPRLLQQAGYKTAHYGKWHLTSNTMPEAPHITEYGFDDGAIFNGVGREVWDGFEMPPDYKKYSAAYLSEGAVKQTIKFIKENKDQPFYINLWIHETHLVINPTPEHRKPYLNVPEPEQSYYACATNADRLIGNVLDALKELGLDENTLVIFSSDNGPEDQNPNPKNKGYFSKGVTGGLRGRKRSLYEGGKRLPFIVKWPGRTPAGKVNKTTQITAVDLLPTFCAIAGIELPEGYAPDGENMLPALLGEDIQRTKPIFWEWRGRIGDTREANWPNLAIREGDWKLIINYDMSRVELYNIPQDWSQERNLADEYPEIVEQLSKKLLEWKSTLPE